MKSHFLTWYPASDTATLHSFGGFGSYTVLAKEKITSGNQMMKMTTNNSKPPTPYLIRARFGSALGVGYFCNERERNQISINAQLLAEMSVIFRHHLT